MIRYTLQLLSSNKLSPEVVVGGNRTFRSLVYGVMLRDSVEDDVQESVLISRLVRCPTSRNLSSGGRMNENDEEKQINLENLTLMQYGGIRISELKTRDSAGQPVRSPIKEENRKVAKKEVEACRSIPATVSVYSADDEKVQDYFNEIELFKREESVIREDEAVFLENEMKKLKEQMPIQTSKLARTLLTKDTSETNIRKFSNETKGTVDINGRSIGRAKMSMNASKTKKLAHDPKIVKDDKDCKSQSRARHPFNSLRRKKSSTRRESWAYRPSSEPCWNNDTALKSENILRVDFRDYFMKSLDQKRSDYLRSLKDHHESDPNPALCCPPVHTRQSRRSNFTRGPDHDQNQGDKKEKEEGEETKESYSQFNLAAYNMMQSRENWNMLTNHPIRRLPKVPKIKKLLNPIADKPSIDNTKEAEEKTRAFVEPEPVRVVDTTCKRCGGHKSLMGKEKLWPKAENLKAEIVSGQAKPRPGSPLFQQHGRSIQSDATSRNDSQNYQMESYMLDVSGPGHSKEAVVQIPVKATTQKEPKYGIIRDQAKKEEEGTHRRKEIPNCRIVDELEQKSQIPWTSTGTVTQYTVLSKPVRPQGISFNVQRHDTPTVTEEQAKEILNAWLARTKETKSLKNPAKTNLPQEAPKKAIEPPQSISNPPKPKPLPTYSVKAIPDKKPHETPKLEGPKEREKNKYIRYFRKQMAKWEVMRNLHQKAPNFLKEPPRRKPHSDKRPMLKDLYPGRSNPDVREAVPIPRNVKPIEVKRPQDKNEGDVKSKTTSTPPPRSRGAKHESLLSKTYAAQEKEMRKWRYRLSALREDDPEGKYSKRNAMNPDYIMSYIKMRRSEAARVYSR